MNPDLEKMLTEMALKLNTSADALWAALLWQARIDAAVNLVAFSAITVVLIIAYAKIQKYRRREDCDDEVVAWAFLVYGVSALVLALIALACLYEGTVAALNPEYWAIKSLMK